ncbi:MAG: hotdog family protein [Gammaproteobacteria bacterium]|nr:hotdog family protein [Gammaproteobacteria bacterium]MBU4281533.1 hotdog family protein [Gammaproteobacteria bacterium]MBU4321869.1 hotdog family protein [Gammaproteobacteria bacterium]MBU4506469.1 hotdog family protein [Gammaproteobacteria bacterium]
MLSRDWIAAHIPHQGSMCLLENVLEWSEQRIVCEALSHTDPLNPLRAADRLGAATGVEYAAQAMAVHGALLAQSAAAPTQGYLTSVRGLSLHVDRLDDQTGPLRITAERLSGDARLILYQFHLHHGERCLIEGRASVVLDAQTL